MVFEMNTSINFFFSSFQKGDTIYVTVLRQLRMRASSYLSHRVGRGLTNDDVMQRPCLGSTVSTDTGRLKYRQSGDCIIDAVSDKRFRRRSASFASFSFRALPSLDAPSLSQPRSTDPGPLRRFFLIKPPLFSR